MMSQYHGQINDEQFWRAFQYVGGELSFEESEVFEQQMRYDVGLCEAVTEAVFLTSQIALSSEQRTGPGRVSVAPSPLPGQQPSGLRRAAAAVATICCCLVVVLILSRHPISTHSPVSVASDSEAADAEFLVTAWAVSSVPETVAVSDFDESDSPDLNVPDWMLAAVTLSDVEDGIHADENSDGLMPDDMELF